MNTGQEKRLRQVLRGKRYKLTHLLKRDIFGSGFVFFILFSHTVHSVGLIHHGTTEAEAQSEKTIEGSSGQSEHIIRGLFVHSQDDADNDKPDRSIKSNDELLNSTLVEVVVPEEDGNGDSLGNIETKQTVSSFLLESSALLKQKKQSRSFSEDDVILASRAWQYFIKNRQAETGLYNSVNQYPRATVWDMASSLAGMVAAEQLGLIEHEQFISEIKNTLHSIHSLPLYNKELPNREYHTKNLTMIGPNNKESKHGSGWSTLDIGRILVWFKIIANWYPELTTTVVTIVKSWDFQRLNKNQQMYGVWFNGRQERLRQEGRLGYEQYAAVGFSLWGIELPKARDYDSIGTTEILKLNIPYDVRPPAYLTSEPFVLSALEFGDIDDVFAAITQLIYEVQKRRWQQTGLLNAVSEDAIDHKPWFLYNTVYRDNEPWKCMTHNGKAAAICQLFSSKAAIGWSVLFSDPFSELLAAKAQTLATSDKGIYAGVYNEDIVNRSLNINTNGIILEALLYLKRGGKPFLGL